jgi:prepilin-type N-terminal cleavage/methylation domain-containing protein
MKINKTSSAHSLLKQRERISAFTLIELLVVIAIIAILASIALPVFSSVQERGKQTKDLAAAKQIGLACKLFAGDHDGKFPYQDGRTTDPPTDLTPLTAAGLTSNVVFASLIPTYVTQEKIFYVAGSAYSPTVPDEVTTPSTARLSAGENNFAYMFGLTDTSNPSYPLIFDGPIAAATTYSTNPATPGGVWKGKKAIVIRCDNSGTVENTTLVSPTTYNIMGRTGAAAPADILVPVAANNWMDPAANLIMYPDP